MCITNDKSIHMYHPNDILPRTEVRGFIAHPIKMAVGVGFEPTDFSRSKVLETSAINHSAIPPNNRMMYYIMFDSLFILYHIIAVLSRMFINYLQNSIFINKNKFFSIWQRPCPLNKIFNVLFVYTTPLI